MSLLLILILSFAVVVLAVAVLRFIVSRRPPKFDAEEAEAVAMAEADRRREAANRPTGGTGMWQ